MANDLLNQIEQRISSAHYRFTHEKDLQALLWDRLVNFGPLQREKELSEQDRVDLWLEPGVAIEVKSKGTYTQALRQVMRYAKNKEVQQLVLVSSCPWAQQTDVPSELLGKPFKMIKVQRAFS